MLPLLTLLLALLGFSCQQPAASDVESNTAAATESDQVPPQWVTYEAKNSPNGKKIVLVSGDEEYRSEEALPMLGKLLAERHGFDCTVLFAQRPDQPGFIDPNYRHNIPGLEQLESADLMILFTRFRELPNEQMQHFENYVMAGKPVLAIRTATHAFNFEDTTHQWQHYGWNYKGDKADWHLGFGKLVSGESWYTHHGHHKHQSTRGRIAPDATGHPITNGIEDGSIWGSTDVYGIRMPMANATPIIMGETVNRAGEYDEKDLFYGMKETDTEVATVNPAEKKEYNPNAPMPPIAWLKTYQIPGGQSGQSFTSTIGSSSDMLDEEVRRLMVNATYHLTGLPVPEKADVNFVGPYNPTPYQFVDDDYWVEKDLRVADYQ